MLSSDELLSAYLDGELTAEEQARAEHLLASDEQARATFEELRAMRSRLQDLPRKALPEDFAARVLRVAEQRVLSSGAAGSLTTGAHHAQRDGYDPVRPAWQQRFRRPLAYVALVLAASLMIVFVSPQSPREESERPVAMAPQTPRPELRAPEHVPEREPARGGPAEPTTGKLVEGLKEPSEDLGGAAPGAVSKKGAESPSPTAEGLTAAPSAQAYQPADGSLVVVTCEITPNAAAQDAFRQVLARNQITLTDGEQSAQSLGRQPRRSGSTVRDAQSNVRSADAGLEVVYVEATPTQLESTLAELSAQRSDFLSVEVDAGNARSVQNRWQAQYNRGRGGLTQQRLLELAPAGTLPAAKPQVAEELADQGRGGQAANQPGQPVGRARAYAMPGEASKQQLSASGTGAAELRQQVARGERATIRDQAEKKDTAAAADEQRTLSLQESGTLRALFVLRVAEGAAPGQPAPAKKE